PAARRRWISPIATAHPSGSRPSRYISIALVSFGVSESTKRIASAVGKMRGESAMMVTPAPFCRVVSWGSGLAVRTGRAQVVKTAWRAVRSGAGSPSCCVERASLDQLHEVVRADPQHRPQSPLAGQVDDL